MSAVWRQHRHKMVIALIWLLVLGTYATFLYRQGLTPRQSLVQGLEFVRHQPLAPLLYLAVYGLRPLLLLPATVLTIAGGALFGWWGILYTIIGANAGASLAYCIGRFFGQGMLPQVFSGQVAHSRGQTSLAEDSRLTRYLTRMQAHPFETILTMRFLFLPYDLINYSAGLLRVPYLAFLLATLLGSIPGTITFVLAGVSTGLETETRGFDWRVLAASVLIFVLSLGIARIVRRSQENTSTYGSPKESNPT